MSIRLYSTAELLALPEPPWLVHDFIHCDEAVAIWGAPGEGKTFVALDLALSIATGVEWLGTFAVRQCPVVYMAGEGSGSLQKRVDAWMYAREVTSIPGAYFQLRPLAFRDEDIVDDVLSALEQYQEDHEHPSSEPGLNAGLIVIDTLSQFFSGGDENGFDMSQFVNNVRRLAQDAGVAVIIVHHANATGGRERGHSALRGNVDVMFKVEGIKKDGRLLGMSILNDKQRDNPNAPKTYVEVRTVRDGLVIYPCDAKRLEDAREHVPLTNPKLLEVLQAFPIVESDKQETALHSDLMDTVGLTRQRLHERLESLRKLKLISSAGQGKSKITLLGRDTVAQTVRAKKPYGAKEDV